MNTASAGHVDSLPSPLQLTLRRPLPRAAFRELGLAFGVWSGIGLFIALERYFYSLSSSTPPPDGRRIAMTAASMWIWAAMTPPILWLAERLPVEAPARARRLGLHFLLSLAFTAAGALGELAIARAIAHPTPPAFLTWMLGQTFIDVFSYFAVLGIGHARRYARMYAERRLRAAALEAELYRTKLQALEMQIRPHFLFNTLHTVSSLVRMERGKEAVFMLATLGELLRAVLRSEGQEVPLRQELGFIERYLAIERVRFADQLKVDVDVEPGLDDALVPHLLLQPLVENAVRHGLASSASGRVEIRARRAAPAELVIEIHDSGEGPPKAAQGGREPGLGLANTRARLRHLYGDAGRLELTSAADGGALVAVSVPLHTKAILEAPLTASAHG